MGIEPILRGPQPPVITIIPWAPQHLLHEYSISCDKNQDPSRNIKKPS